MTQSKYEKEDFAAENMGLINVAIKRYYGRFDESELRSIALVGYAKALKYYEKTEGEGKFSTYAVTIMINEIQDVMRRDYKRQSIRQALSLDYPLAGKNMRKETLLGEVVGEKNDEYALMDLRDCIDKTRLLKTEKEVLQLKLDGFKEKEIAEKLGYSRSYVSLLAKNAKDKLKIEMER